MALQNVEAALPQEQAEKLKEICMKKGWTLQQGLRILATGAIEKEFKELPRCKR